MSDDTEDENLSTEERKMLQLVKEAQSVADNTLAGISIDTPEAYYCAICYLISYNSGTPYHQVKNFSLFDFVINMLMMAEIGKQSNIPGGPAPNQRDMMKMI